MVMPPATQVADALWHCFCPLYARRTLSLPTKTIRTRIQRQPTRRQAPRAASTFVDRTPPVQANSTPATTRPAGAEQSVWRPFLIGEKKAGEWDDLEKTKAFLARKSKYSRPGEWTPNTGDHSVRLDGLYGKWKIKPKSKLYNSMLKRAGHSDKPAVEFLVKMLVEERDEVMDARHYLALVMANTNPELGSAVEVWRLIEEMKTNEIPADSEIYHAALKALAVHPDYVLRGIILEKLEQHWFPLSQEGWQYVIVGLVRDRLVEMALDRLQEMRELGFEPEDWFLNFLITSFISISAFPEALAMLEFRSSYQTPIPSALWSYTLTTAAQNLSHPIVHFVWDHAVKSNFLNPSSGACLAVLNTAARHGDFHLATDVFLVLGKRSTPLARHDYEALLESYLAALDLPNALSVLTIMTSSNSPPDDATCRPLFLYLRGEPKRAATALSILRSYATDSKPVAVATMNAIIEAQIHNNDLPGALETYNVVYELCSASPTTHTFNALLRGCTYALRKDTAMFCAAEMRATKVPPDALTYDRLMLVCMASKDETGFDDALRYFDEMKSKGWWPRNGTVEKLCATMTRRGDAAIFEILEEGEKRGMNMARPRRYVEERWDPKDIETRKAAGLELAEMPDVAKTRLGQGPSLEEKQERLRRRAAGRGGKWTTREEFEVWKVQQR